MNTIDMWDELRTYNELSKRSASQALQMIDDTINLVWASDLTDAEKIEYLQEMFVCPE